MSELTPTSPSIAAPDILLVDDSQDDIDLLMLAFESNKSAVTVAVARDGVAALNLLLGGENRPVDVRGALPRVVLLDRLT